MGNLRPPEAEALPNFSTIVGLRGSYGLQRRKPCQNPRSKVDPRGRFDLQRYIDLVIFYGELRQEITLPHIQGIQLVLES